MKSEISELLSCISKEEFERLGDFIRSPYFNKLPRMIKLYEFLYENYEELQKGTLSRECISKFMYPGEEFRNDSIRKLLSDFDKLLECFAAQLEFEKTEWDKKIFTLKALRERNCDKFEKRLKDYNKEHKNSTEGFDEFYATKLKLISEEFEFYFSTNLNEQNEINQEKSDAIDSEFISKKLFLFQYMKSREYVNKEVKYSYTFWQEIEDHLKNNKTAIIKSDPELYRNFLGTQYILSNNSEKILEKIKQFIDEQKYYKKKMGKPYWDYINYCIIQTNNGKEQYYENIYQYFLLLSENNLISDEIKSSPDYFQIIVSACLHCKQFEQLEIFITKFKSKIRFEYRNDIVNLANAQLHFHKSDFDKAILFSKQISFSDYLLYIAAKGIQLKAAYELDDFIEINSIRETFKKYFIQHNEIPSIYKVRSEIYIDFLIRLSKVKENVTLYKETEYEIDRICKDLKLSQNIIGKIDWLEEKALEIKNR